MVSRMLSLSLSPIARSMDLLLTQAWSGSLMLEHETSEGRKGSNGRDLVRRLLKFVVRVRIVGNGHSPFFPLIYHIVV